jgi:hypothetical protein
VASKGFHKASIIFYKLENPHYPSLFEHAMAHFKCLLPLQFKMDTMYLSSKPLFLFKKWQQNMLYNLINIFLLYNHSLNELATSTRFYEFISISGFHWHYFPLLDLACALSYYKYFHFVARLITLSQIDCIFHIYQSLCFTDIYFNIFELLVDKAWVFFINNNYIRQ